MAWRFVKQPNGKLALFSDIVDTFTYYNCSEEECIRICTEEKGMSLSDAKEKVKGGVEDWVPWTHKEKGDGQSRWKDCCETIISVHGEKELNKFIKEMNSDES